ncbi:MAG: cytochrome c oxidase subunit 3 [Ktedonobacterales bacterium]
MSAVVNRVEVREEATPHSRAVSWYGMVFFLASEAVFFANLIAAYLYLRVRAGQWPPAPYTNFQFERVIPIVNTCILLASSFPMHFGARAIARGNTRLGWRLIGLTAFMGAVFLGGQAYEYTHAAFAGRAFTPDSGTFGSTFFVLTGFHGAHVTAGVIFLIICATRASRGHFSKDKHFAVTAAEMYWHFVDVVWVILFSVLYLL